MRSSSISCKSHALLVSLFLLISLLPPASAVNVPHMLRASTPISMKKCESTLDCQSAGESCRCVNNDCVHSDMAIANAEACPNCNANSDCKGNAVVPSSVDVCNETATETGTKCYSCVHQVLIDAHAKCDDTKATPPPKSPPSSSVCVSTAWLYRHGHQHAALRHGDVAPVLCISGLRNLPCGTPGHLLRHCTSDASSCALMTYAEVCARRADCVSTAMPVSQLAHKYNWAQFVANTTEGYLELTSLSADPMSNPSFMSRKLAKLADVCNRNGLAFLVDWVVIQSSKAQAFLRAMLASDSTPQSHAML